MYTCTICLGLNHNARLHCQYCGTMPAQYSIIQKPMEFRLDGSSYGVEVIVAHGADRQERHHTTRCNLQTVTLDYYGE